jgi:hypothetical protein
MENRYHKLTNNLEAMLHESIVKIGYVKEQPVGIYYTDELLYHLLDISKVLVEKDKIQEKAMQLLDEFSRENEPIWGKILFSRENGRYKLTVPAKGMEYVYNKNKDNHFLRDLIEALRSPNITIDKILQVFYQYSPDVICEKSDDDEFEYAVHFTDKTIDPFIYCFTFDEMGKYYHRFTEFDYMNLTKH